jgi:hypothetical protein
MMQRCIAQPVAILTHAFVVGSMLYTEESWTFASKCPKPVLLPPVDPCMVRWYCVPIQCAMVREQGHPGYAAPGLGATSNGPDTVVMFDLQRTQETVRTHEMSAATRTQGMRLMWHPP